MGRLLFLLPLALFAVVAAYFAIPILTKDDPHTLPSALIDKPAPAGDLPPLVHGKPGLDPATIAGGDVKLVNFFASWCGPCRIEHPLLMRMSEERRAPLYGVNYKDKPEAALDWLRQLGDPFERIGTDRSGRVAIDWGVYGVPETYVVDQKGHIRHRHVGPLSRTDLEETIMPLVEKLRAGGGS